MKRKNIGSLDVGLLADQAYEKLKMAILEKELPPGIRISERELSARMKTSNTTIKRALHKLSIEGLVEIRPRSGTFVSGLGEVNTEEITKIRAGLEGLAAGFAAGKASPEDIRAMEEHIETMKALTEAGDSGALVEANAAFHSMIHAAARNPYIVRLIAVMQSFEIGFRRLTLTTRRELKYGFDGHRGVFEAIRAGNPELAESRMRAHILGTLKGYLAAAKPKKIARPSPRSSSRAGP